MHIKSRSSQWETWHKNGAGNNAIASLSDQCIQFELLNNTFTFNDTQPYNILEIGPWDGGLCNMILSKYQNINSYTLIDDISRLNICKTTLNQYNQIKYIDIDNIHSITNQPFDLLISNNCLSETTTEYQTYIFSKIFKNCNSVFIIDNFNKSPQFNMNSTEYLHQLTIALNDNFNNVLINNTIFNHHMKKLLFATNNE